MGDEHIREAEFRFVSGDMSLRGVTLGKFLGVTAEEVVTACLNNPDFDLQESVLTEEDPAWAKEEIKDHIGEMLNTKFKTYEGGVSNGFLEEDINIWETDQLGVYVAAIEIQRLLDKKAIELRKGDNQNARA